MQLRSVPPGWNQLPLGEVATLQRGFDLPIQGRIEGLIPVYGSNGIDGWHSRHAVSGPGVITGRSGSIGFVFYEENDFWPLNTTLYVRDFHGNHPSFVVYLLEALRLSRFSASTGVPSLNRNFVHPIPVLVPPLPEQHRIAEILDAADEAIRQTERVIAKLKAVKAGLLHDLLTRGLDQHGHLRDPHAHSEQFKDSPLGRIPREWNVGGLSSFLKESDGIKPGPFGSSITKRMYMSGGYRVYGQEQVIAGTLSVGDYYISQSKYLELQSFAVHEMDLLVSLVGTIGEVLVIHSPFEPGVINPRLIRLRPNPVECDIEFLKHLLVSTLVRGQMTRIAQGGTMSVLSGAVLRKLTLAKPPTKEQSRIATILNRHGARIRAEEVELAKLRRVKRGLMDDLLTGRVRVSP